MLFKTPKEKKRSQKSDRFIYYYENKMLNLPKQLFGNL